MIVSATQTHRRHGTLIVLLEKRVDRLEEHGSNSRRRVGQVGIQTQVPVTSTCLFIRLKFPRPTASAPGIAKARLVNYAAPFRKVTFCAFSSEATIGASAAAFASFFFRPVPLPAG